MSEPTNKSFRFAVKPEQGVGFIENTGDDWVMPESQAFSNVINDTDGQPHAILFCAKDGKPYDISSREGPVGSTISRIWKDKITTAGTGGTDVIPVLNLPEDTGERDHFFIGALEEDVTILPYDDDNRNTPGHDSLGYPTGLEVTLKVFEDGEPTIYKAKADNIPKTGNTTWDKQVDANRLQTQISANMGDHIISRRTAYFDAQDVTASPSNILTAEMGYQAEFAEPQLWAAIVNGSLINRATGNAITATYTPSTSPDGNTLGIAINAAITLGSVVLAAGHILVWYKGVIAMTIGGAVQALTNYSTTTVDGWTLAYASPVNHTGAVVITPTGAAEIFDFRAYAASITAHGTDYYLDDFVKNDGKNFLPNGQT